MNYPVLYQWTLEIANRLPSLNSWQAANVALFSIGVLRAENCQQAPVARQLIAGEKVASCMRRWRRFLDNARFPLARFFTDWTRWVVSCLQPARVTLLVDETKLGDRLAAMVVGLAWRQRCLPLAWRCYRANSAAAYPAEGQVQMIAQLLAAVGAGLPPGAQPLVLADRGIGTSSAMCQAVVDLGWHFLFRVASGSTIATEAGVKNIAAMVQPGEQWSASGLVFPTRGAVPATAHALWDPAAGEPWALITNDPTLTGWTYAQRNWQEQSFRDLKSGGWQWHNSRIRHADHLARLLVILTVAYTWCVALGSVAVQQGRTHPGQRQHDGRFRPHWSLFKEGLQFFVEQVQRHGLFIALVFCTEHRFP